MQPRLLRHLLQASLDDRMGVRAFLSSLAALVLATSASAQWAPWGDVAPAMSPTHVHCAALGRADHRVEAWSARKLSARRRGIQRARRMLHRWVDDALARVGAPPHVAERAHREIERAELMDVRALADGSAVVVVGVERSALPAFRGVPW